MSKLLLLEDDTGLIDGLTYTLKKNDYEVVVVTTVREAKQKIDECCAVDLMILDVSLPDGSGFEVCEYVRSKDVQVPIIFLTAADEEFNVIRGLDSGADDYITKPFRLGELCSRIHALLRRSQRAKTNEVIHSGAIRVDLPGNRAYYKDQALECTAVEFRLLCIFLQNKNRILTRQVIFDAMWDGQGDFVDDNTLSVYIRRLREKIEEDPSHPHYLKTVRGQGYLWEE